MPISFPPQLLRAAPADDETSLVLELVFDTLWRAPDVQTMLDQAVDGASPRVEAVFATEGDRFFFVTFPEGLSDGQEPAAFAFARALKAEIGASDVNVLLNDSIYGALDIDAEVESAVFSCSTPKDMTLPFGWVHPKINTPAAWQKSRGAGVTVAVIDTGFSSHSELSGILSGKRQLNLVEGGNDATDRFTSGFLKHPGHGTLVASVVASRGDAAPDGTTTRPGAVSGAAPQAEILPIRAISSVINRKQKTLPAAIDHAIAEGADVIVMAQGGPSRVASTEEVLRRARAAGIVVCCAAGNCWGPVVFPAAYAPLGLCTAIAALEPDMKSPWAKSSRGPEVTLSAPGEQVWGAVKRSTADSDHGITASQGTTLATSLTTGVAACWVAHHGGRRALKTKADALGTHVQALWNAAVTHGLRPPDTWGPGTGLGAGVLDAGSALDAPLQTIAPEGVAETEAPAQTTAQIALAHLTSYAPEAASEFEGEMAEYAGEILWLSFRARAQSRLAEATESPVRADRASPELSAVLSARPALATALGQG